uniref:ATP-dependent RNA helicase DHX30 n=1 Tax=Myxine glutinosa TaxID=7769 RepID=UPI00358DE818
MNCGLLRKAGQTGIPMILWPSSGVTNAIRIAQSHSHVGSLQLLASVWNCSNGRALGSRSSNWRSEKGGDRGGVNEGFGSKDGSDDHNGQSGGDDMGGWWSTLGEFTKQMDKGAKIDDRAKRPASQWNRVIEARSRRKSRFVSHARKPPSMANSMVVEPFESSLTNVGKSGITKPSARSDQTGGLDNVAAISALARFPQPKQLLNNVLQTATGNPASKYIQYRLNLHQPFTCRLKLSWPSPKKFVAQSSRKEHAKRQVTALACMWLQEQGLVSSQGQPLPQVTYYQEEVKKSQERNALPTPVSLPPTLASQLQDYLVQNEYSEEEQQDLMDEEDFDLEGFRKQDVFTGKDYTPLDAELESSMNLKLNRLWSPGMRPPVSKLPINKYKDEILMALDHHRVVIISGDTGCGKTTRIPQFILERAALAGRGVDCNVVVTQPRRLSAIAVCQRVQHELGSALRYNIGYQVRLDSLPPKPGGALLFCTVGVLLRKLQGNPTLCGVSHVIVDEVHERSIDTDFLLALLRPALHANLGLHVILASAALDTTRLSNYFGGAPVVKVPGKVFPIKTYYLPEVCRMMGHKELPETDDPSPNLDFISDVVIAVDRNGEPGGILCFLPGWQEICGVKERLQQAQHGHLLVLPVHSSLPKIDQQAIFQKPPQNVRKVVLATTIAETAITIDDIVHVIDTGCRKQHNYDPRCQVSSLDTEWVSRANVIQRRGRAGRCRPGFAYHLFSQNRLEALAEFEIPEILRTPLENLVLQAKVHVPHMRAGEFLSQALDRPSRRAVQEAVTNLQDLELFNDNENLTALGRHVSHVAAGPHLAKAVVLAASLHCLQPLLAIVACLTNDPFRSVPSERANLNQVKRNLVRDSRSDHLAYVLGMEAWERAELGFERFSRFNRIQQQHDVAQGLLLHPPAVRFVKGLMQQFAQNLKEAGLVGNTKSCLSPHAEYNKMSQEHELVLGVLTAGLYPNLIQIRRGALTSNKKFRPNDLSFRTRSGHVILHSSSINRNEEVFHSRYLVYHTAVRSNGQVFIRDCSMINPLALLLLTHAPLSLQETQEGVLLELGEGAFVVRLCASPPDTQLLCSLRKAVRRMLVERLNGPVVTPAARARHTALLQLLVAVLNAPQQSFSEGLHSCDTGDKPILVEEGFCSN